MNNEYDKKLADQGWEAMRRTLDREMPERRRRRPLAWWWLPLLLLPLAAGGGWWWLERQSAPIPAMQVPATTLPATGQPGRQESTAPSSGNRPQATATPNRETLQLSSTASSPAASRKKSTPVQTPDTPSKNIPAPATGPAFALVPVYPQPGATAETAQPAATAGERPAAFHDPLPALPVALSAPVPDPSAPLRLVKVETAPYTAPVRPQRSGRWSFGLATGLASESFGAVDAWLAGPAVNWQFSRKWGLRSGLHYSQYRLSAGERPVVTVNNDQYVSATGNLDVAIDFLNNPASGNQQDPVVLVPVEKLHRIELPLLAYWQPVRPVRIFGGASVAYNLSAKAAAENFANNKIYYADSKEALDNLSELTAGTLPTWQFSLQTGTGFRLGRHFELDAFYKFGLGNNAANKALGLQANTNGSITNLDGLQSNSALPGSYFLLSGIWFF